MLWDIFVAFVCYTTFTSSNYWLDSQCASPQSQSCAILASVPAFPNAMESTDLTIRVSADGHCHFAEVVVQCDALGAMLVSMHMVPTGHIHIEVGPDARYEVIAALLKSLEQVGISPSRVGFVRAESHQ